MENARLYLFYKLIRAGLWEQDVELPKCEEVSYSELFRVADEQSVIGLISAGIDHVQDDNVPKGVKLNIIGRALQIEKQNRAMNEFIAKQVEKLRQKEVYVLLVKGQGVAQCYERPLWRSSGDVDLFLSEDNFQRAKEVLTPYASSVEKEHAYSKHLGMTISGWGVELHGTLRSGFSSRADRVMDAISQETFYGGNVRSWMNGQTQVFMLSVENDVLYVFIHFLKHFYKEGLGLRQICDWCRLLWTYRDEVNVPLVEKRVKEMGLLSEWQAFAAYAVEYLGMPVEAMPMYSPAEKWIRKAQQINKFILQVGNMGHNRDSSYMKYPFVIRKCFSVRRRIGDLINHARIFPLDSLRFFPRIMYNGVRSAVRGEG